MARNNSIRKWFFSWLETIAVANGSFQKISVKFSAWHISLISSTTSCGSLTLLCM